MRATVCLIVTSFLIAGPSMGCFATPQAYQGAGVGAAGGGLAGALIDRQNPWRGGLIGSLIGGTVTGSAVEMSSQASRQAAQANRPVAYESEDRAQRIEAQPLPRYPSGPPTECGDVRTLYYEHGELIKEEIRRECR